MEKALGKCHSDLQVIRDSSLHSRMMPPAQEVSSRLVIKYGRIHTAARARRLFPPRGRSAYQVNHQGHRHPPTFSLLKQTETEDKYLHMTAIPKDSMPIIKEEDAVARYRW